MDIHNYKRRLARTLENIKNSNLSKENIRLIVKFHDNCFTEGLSVCKIERYIYDIQRFASMLNKGLLEATKDDIKAIVAEVEKKDWSPHTKHTFKVAIRKFYKSIEEVDEKGVYPERVRWLHSTVKNNQLKLPEELLTEEDIEKMINSSYSHRDRAFISILYESGCRIGEIGSMRIKDVSFDEYGLKARVSGKTGARSIRLINSSPYLQQWINIHPENHNPDSYLWISGSKRKILSYARLCDIPKNLARVAGIRKRIHPHLFRHSRATHLAKHLTEAQMKAYLGWTQSSKMAAVYVHLSGRDVDNAILELNGIKVREEEKREDKLKAINCVRCKTQNEATNKFCKLCGIVLDKDEANKIIKEDFNRKEADDLMNKLLNDKEILDLIKRKISS